MTPLTDSHSYNLQKIIPISQGSDPGATQTHDLQNRNLTLYSTKLRGQNRRKGIKRIDNEQSTVNYFSNYHLIILP